MSSSNFSTCIEVQSKCRTVKIALLQNTHRSFSTEPNPKDYAFEMIASRFNLLRKDHNFISKIH